MNQFVYCDVNLCIGCGMCERQCIMSHYDLKMTDVKLNDPLQRARCKTYRHAGIESGGSPQAM